VLNAQAELREAELAQVRARRDAYVAGASLLNAMGLLEARQLTPGVELYDPASAFERIRRSHQLPWEPIIEGLDSIGAPQIEQRPPLPPATVAAKTEMQTTASLDAVVDASLKRP
jgi:outer membrane protein